MGDRARTPTLTALLCLVSCLHIIAFLSSGMYEKPSISAQPGPSVSWGEKVTLQCRSEISLDSFHLSKEGSPAHFQALFPVGPVTPSHRWTFRCYGCYKNYPHVWSHPSNPLELLVSGEAPQPCLWSWCRWPCPVKGRKDHGWTSRDPGLIFL
uniref:Uncharacterized protein n=1 Tax=Equus asinus asinus TaxID=83772 RepID=A0A8C4MSH8_EQUAS